MTQTQDMSKLMQHYAMKIDNVAAGIEALWSPVGIVSKSGVHDDVSFRCHRWIVSCFDHRYRDRGVVKAVSEDCIRIENRVDSIARYLSHARGCYRGNFNKITVAVPYVERIRR